MEVLHERCAALDISKGDVKACVRVPNPRRKGRPHPAGQDLRVDDQRAAGAAGLATPRAGQRGVHGGHRRLLETGVLPARGSAGSS